MNHKRKKPKINSRNMAGCSQKGSRKSEATPGYWDTLYHAQEGVETNLLANQSDMVIILMRLPGTLAIENHITTTGSVII